MARGQIKIFRLCACHEISISGVQHEKLTPNVNYISHHGPVERRNLRLTPGINGMEMGPVQFVKIHLNHNPIKSAYRRHLCFPRAQKFYHTFPQTKLPRFTRGSFQIPNSNFFSPPLLFPHVRFQFVAEFRMRDINQGARAFANRLAVQMRDAVFGDDVMHIAARGDDARARF